MNSSITLQHPFPLWRRFPPIKWPEAFMLSAGGILLLGGASKTLAVLKHAQVLDLTDPLSGLPFRYVLALSRSRAWRMALARRSSSIIGVLIWKSRFCQPTGKA
jgi:hypothetical protein